MTAIVARWSPRVGRRPSRSSRSARSVTADVVGIASAARRAPAIAASSSSRRCVDSRELDPRAGVAGKHAERRACMAPRRVRVTEPELELGELDVRPGGGLRLAGGGIECEPHRLDGALAIAHELARVRDARIRGEARTKRHHALERGERLVVAAELDRARLRSRRTAATTPAEAFVRVCPCCSAARNSCLMSASEPRPSTASASSTPKRTARPQGGLGTREVRRIGSLPPAQLIREAELREEPGVARLRPNLCLERRERRGADTAGRSGERPICERHRSGRGCRGRARLGEDAADEPSECERHRSGAAHEECRPASHAEPLSPTCVPYARSPGWAPRRRGSSAGTRSRSGPPRLRRRCSECGSHSRRRTRSPR